MGTRPKVAGATGIEHAIAACGRPLEWHCTYDSSSDGLAYWQLVAADRSAEVVLPLRRTDGLILLHTKGFYPAGTFRMLTGGVRPGEDLLAAAAREAREETGLQVTIERFLGIIHHLFVHRGDSVALDSYILLAVGPGEAPHPADEDEGITGYREVPAEGLLAVAKQLEALPAEWAEWGRFRASPHCLAYEALTGRVSHDG
ncbi:MAG: NUDIX hydrolase [Chloroflexi bacterium]|jgi:NAD+ diphosphatase|nr:NUDIX hydrolase [Chloroflexota bacterium]